MTNITLAPLQQFVYTVYCRLIGLINNNQSTIFDNFSQKTPSLSISYQFFRCHSNAAATCICCTLKIKGIQRISRKRRVLLIATTTISSYYTVTVDATCLCKCVCVHISDRHFLCCVFFVRISFSQCAMRVSFVASSPCIFKAVAKFLYIPYLFVFRFIDGGFRDKNEMKKFVRMCAR